MPCSLPSYLGKAAVSSADNTAFVEAAAGAADRKTVIKSIIIHIVLLADFKPLTSLSSSYDDYIIASMLLTVYGYSSEFFTKKGCQYGNPVKTVCYFLFFLIIRTTMTITAAAIRRYGLAPRMNTLRFLKN